MSGSPSRYDWEEIRANREAGVPWRVIAEPYGVAADTVRGAFSRWLQTVEGQKAPKYRRPSPAFVKGEHLVIQSRDDNTYLFGIAGDRHHASKYHRDDVLADLYKRFEAAGTDCIFDTGNWIDGESKFNKYDLTRIGMTQQLHLMAEQTPDSSVPTFAVWGDCHEGWYAQREGIDIGEYAQQVMRQAGHDWYNLGFLEAHVRLRNVNSGKEAMMSVMHPGGGTAYALSYRPQKIVEALEGGEKPAVILMGHYHKLEALNIRNVWTLQTGTCCDQTPFMRKQSIEAHVGGVLLGIEQDPETGAVIGFTPQMVRYFNRGFYGERWSKHGPIDRAERIVIPPQVKQ